jgi:hypothetical protein
VFVEQYVSVSTPRIPFISNTQDCSSFNSFPDGEHQETAITMHDPKQHSIFWTRDNQKRQFTYARLSHCPDARRSGTSMSQPRSTLCFTLFWLSQHIDSAHVISQNRSRESLRNDGNYKLFSNCRTVNLTWWRLDLRSMQLADSDAKISPHLHGFHVEEEM